MSTWLDGFWDNVWMRIVRYDTATSRFKAAGLSIPNVRAVDNMTALDAIPKTSANDELVVLVRDQPQEKNLFIYTHSTTRWKTLNTHPIGATAKSVMWMMDYPVAHQTGYSQFGTSFLQTARIPYYSVSITLTNIDSTGNYLRTKRFNRGCTKTTGGSLRFTKAARTLEWKAPGDSNYGPTVDVSRSGFYRLESATANMDLCISVESANEPGADATDSVDLTSAGTPQISMHGGPSAVGQFNSLYGNPWRENQYLVLASFFTTQSLTASYPDWINIHTDLTVINWTFTGISSLSNTNTALTNLQTVIQYRQERGSRVVVMTPLEHNSNTDAKIQLFSHVSQRLQAMAYSMGFEIIDTNAYLRDPLAGTLSDPIPANNQATDLARLSCRGAYLIAKYSMYPVLSKYMPQVSLNSAKINPIVAYSATETWGNLLTNGRWKGTAGTKANARCTGEVADNWTLSTSSGTVLTAVGAMPDGATPVARTDGLPGKWARFTISNAGGVDGETCTVKQTSDVSSSNYTTGDVVAFSGSIRISGASGVRDIRVQVSSTNGNSFILGSSTNTDFYPVDYAGESPVYYLSSMPFIIGSGTTSLNVQITITMSAGGAVVVDVGQDWVLRKIV